ncbi:MAG: hypothetical protein JRN09_01895 [Nitrososphaerota archaeon]|nr:hypothetical protein [Nitrososphaerota archaeon]
MRGWIFDLYPGQPGEMVVWMKDADGRAHRLVDSWAPSFYVACDSRERLVGLSASPDVQRYAARTEFVQRRERITDGCESTVLKVTVRDAAKMLELARVIERESAFGDARIYNCDVPPGQSYMYERDIFPLALCDVREGPYGLRWALDDDVREYDYALPPLRTMSVGVRGSRSGLITKADDPVEEVWLEDRSRREVIGGASEREKILGLVERVRELDLDILLTRDGDRFLFPYLIARAERNRVAERLVLGRDPVALKSPERTGTSYFSYGKVLFKPSSMRIYGRLHLDTSVSFSHSHSGLSGLFEISRVCVQPLHTSSRASIGKALSSLQFYHATKQGILIPWKPTLAERFKSRSELLVADRGGFIYEPLSGVYDDVAEFDFASLYPNIMRKKNISAETVKCGCCPDSGEVVPELGWNVCEKRKGITSEAMEVIVEKRLEYKRRKGSAKGELKERYQGCQDALKWLGVTCVPRESPVLVHHGDKDKLVRIGDFIDGLSGERTGVIECPPGIFVAGVGQDLRAKYSRVANLIRKPNDQNLLSVEMEDGRRIVTTPDHPFFTLGEGELRVTLADKLEVGKVIPVAKKIPSMTGTHDRIDLIEQLVKSISVEEQRLWRVSGEHLKEEMRSRRQTLLKAALSEGYSYQAVVAWIKSGIIPLRFLRLIEATPALHEGLRIGVGRRPGGRMAWLPVIIKIDEKLGFFLGLFVADGSATRACVRLDIATLEPGLLKTAKEAVESLFGISPRIYKEREARMNVVQVNSASLVRVLEKVFDLPGSAEKGKMKVPDIVFNCRELVVHRFIAGLVAGDGHVSRIRKFVGIATASKDLQNQVAFLAARLGLTFRLAINREGGATLHTINFVGPETMGSIASWGYSKENRGPTIQAWSKESPYTCNHPRYVRIPASESGLFSLTKATRTPSEPHVHDHSRICPVQVKKKLGRMYSKRLSGVQREQMSKVDRLLDCDLGFVRIRKIERIDCRPEYVYCFQLADDEVPGFFTGEGLVFTHNCFGYLGFNNAKFGRIDAHIAVCAWDREILLRSVRIAEREGFRVIHGIVDSLWLKKAGATRGDYKRLKEEIERETGFDLSFEGIYNWIAFLNSRTDPRLPVQNRYFGVYSDGTTKIRGIESRRRDTPAVFRACQDDILKVMKNAGSVDEVRAAIPTCVDVFRRYAEAIRRKEVPVKAMVFTKNISKEPKGYRNDTLEAGVVKALLREGAALHQGESVSYVITDFYSRGARAIPSEALDGRRCYDTRRYVELLSEVCATLLEPFDAGMTSQGLLDALTADTHDRLA